MEKINEPKKSKGGRPRVDIRKEVGSFRLEEDVIKKLREINRFYKGGLNAYFRVMLNMDGKE